MATASSPDSQKIGQPVLCLGVRGEPGAKAGARAQSSQIPGGRDGVNLRVSQLPLLFFLTLKLSYRNQGERFCVTSFLPLTVILTAF